jgi:alginate O-acetyltransferase complex protein AlgI
LSSAFLDGIWLITTGMFIKVVLADGVAPSVDQAFSRPHESVGATDVWLMAVAFGLQIYFDFSSYTRMAIGSAVHSAAS